MFLDFVGPITAHKSIWYYLCLCILLRVKTVWNTSSLSPHPFPPLPFLDRELSINIFYLVKSKHKLTIGDSEHFYILSSLTQ